MDLAIREYAPDSHAFPAPSHGFALVPAGVAPANTTTYEDDLNTMVDTLTYASSGSNVPRVNRNPLGYPNTSYSDVSTATNLPVAGNSFFSPSNLHLHSGYVPLSGPYPPSLDRYLFSPGHNVNTYRPLDQPEFPATALRLPYNGRKLPRMNTIGGNNVVNVFRITHGQDVRTTVSFFLSIIRNLNKC